MKNENSYYNRKKMIHSINCNKLNTLERRGRSLICWAFSECARPQKEREENDLSLLDSDAPHTWKKKERPYRPSKEVK